MKIQFVMTNEEFDEIARVQDIYAEKLGISKNAFTENGNVIYLNDLTKVSFDCDHKYTMYWCEIFDALSDRIVSVFKVIKQFSYLLTGLKEEFEKKIAEIRKRENNED